MSSSWQLYAGDPSVLSMHLKIDGVPANLSEYSDWKCQWRTSSSSEKAVDIFVDDSEKASGKIRLYITPEQTSVDNGPVRTGVWDVQAMLDNEPRTFLRGTTQWTRDVTR